MTDAIMTDHALVRWLERVYGLDIDGLKAQIADGLVSSAAAVGASAVVKDGAKFILDGGRIVTVLSKEQRVKRRDRKRAVDLDADAEDGNGAMPGADREAKELNMLNVQAKPQNCKGSSGVFKDEETAKAILDRMREKTVDAEGWLRERIAMSKTLPANELISQVVTITPELAGVILADCNRGNRRLRRKRINMYAEAIKEERWKLHSQGLSFSRDGHLNNGQHRLSAIIQAGQSVPMMVVFGEDRDVFDVLDTGGVRGGSDTLHIAGYKNTSTLAAAARLYAIVTSDNPSANAMLANDEIRRIIAEHPDLEEMSTPGHSVGAKLRCSTAATTTAFYLIESHSPNSRRLELFIERLKDGASLRKRDPILVLRDGLKDRQFEMARDGTGKNVNVCASIILAWNKWLRGKTATVKALREWGGDQFPMPE